MRIEQVSPLVVDLPDCRQHLLVAVGAPGRLLTSSRSDLFSLGLVMFELLSGEPFYQGAGVGEILYQAATGPTMDHLGRIAKLPGPAPDILRRALSMDATGRYPSARLFAKELTTSATMLKGQLAEMMRALFAAD